MRLARPADFDGRFHFCRLVYEPSPTGTGGSWRTDFPRADINMSIRLSELTKTPVSFDRPRSRIHSSSAHRRCALSVPVRAHVGAGSAGFDDKDAAKLREFVLKGGFLWADDFWGSYQWDQWEIADCARCCRRGLSDCRSPVDSPMLTSAVHRQRGAADSEHRLLHALRRGHVRAGVRQHHSTRAHHRRRRRRA